MPVGNRHCWYYQQILVDPEYRHRGIIDPLVLGPLVGLIAADFRDGNYFHVATLTHGVFANLLWDITRFDEEGREVAAWDFWSTVERYATPELDGLIEQEEPYMTLVELLREIGQDLDESRPLAAVKALDEVILGFLIQPSHYNHVRTLSMLLWHNLWVVLDNFSQKMRGSSLKDIKLPLNLSPV